MTKKDYERAAMIAQTQPHGIFGIEWTCVPGANVKARKVKAND